MVYRRKKMHYGDTHLKRRWATKRRTKDLDQATENKSAVDFKRLEVGVKASAGRYVCLQIDKDLKPENVEKLISQEVDLDKPGSAQFYCVHCARYFIDDSALQDHFRTKVHKRRLKALELEPYTIEDSERAAGHGSFKQPTKRKIETQPSKEAKQMKIDDDE